jgi:hypothetical protein
MHPTSPEEALEVLKKLVKGENAFELAQTQLNFRWGTVSQKIHWAQFTPTNPRERWIKMIKQNPQLDSEVLQCIQQDKVGKSIFYWLWEAKKSGVKKILTTDSLESFKRNWVCELNQRKNAEVLNQNSLLAIRNQSGQIRHSEKIDPKQLVKLSLSHNPMGGDVKLVINFKGRDRSLSRSQQVSEANDSLLVLSPIWTEEVEFCIQFDKAIDLKALEISQLSP